MSAIVAAATKIADSSAFLSAASAVQGTTFAVDGAFSMASGDMTLGATTITVTGFFFQAEDGIRDRCVTGVQTCALPISCCHPALALEARVALTLRTVCGVPTA